MIVIGVIAEDDSDIEVVEALLKKYRRPRPSKIQPVAAGGCGRIRAKCRSWATNLAARGCTRLILLQDCDEQNSRTLGDELTNALTPSPIKMHVIVIPVREIEAWLLADVNAVAEALHIQKKLKNVQNPEALRRPKEHLRDLIRTSSKNKTRYINSIHNPRIAARCDVVRLLKCDSYKPLDTFIRTHC